MEVEKWRVRGETIFIGEGFMEDDEIRGWNWDALEAIEDAT